LKEVANARFIGRIRSLLAGGQIIEEDSYLVHFPFDGMILTADATFVDQKELLIGTHLLRAHLLTIDFPAGTVLLKQS
jgi:hypothetical protein